MDLEVHDDDDGASPAGEAFSSMCYVGDVKLTTKTTESPLATSISFDDRGNITSQSGTSWSYSNGTRVTISRIFSRFPVRLMDFQKNRKKYYLKMLSLVQAYAMILTHVRFRMSAVTSSNNKSEVVITTPGNQPPPAPDSRWNDCFKKNIMCILGTMDLMIPVRWSAAGCTLTGWTVGPGGAKSRDKQYIFLNGRPVDMPRLLRVVNDCWRVFASGVPFIAVNLFITQKYDINVSPDKRTVMLSDEDELLASSRVCMIRRMMMMMIDIFQ